MRNAPADRTEEGKNFLSPTGGSSRSGIGTAVTGLFVLLLAAGTFARNSVWRDGMTLWSDTQRKAPAKHRPYIGIAQARQMRNDHEGAVEAARKGLALNPSDPEANIIIGVSYLETGRADEAISHFRTVLASRPDYANAYNSLGNAYVRKGMVDEAIAAYRTAIRLAPQASPYRVNLAGAYGTKGWFGMAVAELTSVIAENPGLPDAHYNLGIALRLSGRTDEAVAALLTSLRLRQDDPRTLFYLGEILLVDKGDRAAAMPYYRLLLSRDPDGPYAGRARQRIGESGP